MSNLKTRQGCVSNWKTLEKLCQSNLETFQNRKDVNGRTLKASLESISENLNLMEPLYKKIATLAPLYDFDPKTPGNGYRSYLKLVDTCIEQLVSINEKLFIQESPGFFQNHEKDLEAYSKLLIMLYSYLRCSEAMHNYQKDKNQDSLLSDQNPTDVYEKARAVDIPDCFYGRCLGFQYCEDLKMPLSLVASSMASYNEVFYNNGTLLNKFKNILSCWLKPEERAKQLVYVFRRRRIDFFKSFFSLNEAPFIHFCNSLMSVSIAVDKTIPIPPKEMTATTFDGEEIRIPVPASHVGKKPIRVRLLSSKRRIGMVGSREFKGDLGAPSESLIFHTHGGGFVVQSSRSHEVYLRDWAVELDVPILCIDYSLAPEAPYPRALEELLYVYAWVLKHGSTMLGSALKKIVLAGDSAGANLNVALTLKILELNLRKPDGILTLYAPLLLECASSPSRMLGTCDALLPICFSVKCAKAYLSIDDPPLDHELDKELIENPVKQLYFTAPRDPFSSPLLAPDEILAKMPPMKIISTDLDPYLDDCVTFAKKLKAFGTLVTLDVLPGLPHAFLNFVGVSKEAQNGSKLCISRLRELLNLPM